jgi:hypothetical protein
MPAWGQSPANSSKVLHTLRSTAPRHERRRDLLVPDVDPLDLALSPQRVGQAVEAIADNAID